jgi:hypothetical protein
MANIIVSGYSSSFVNGTYTDNENGTWSKVVSVSDDASGLIEIFYFAPTQLWYLQGNSVYSTASGGNAGSDPTTLSWSNNAKLTFAALPAPTFGLGNETVTLITSRFRTVANFLRLRNQGQV